MTAFASKRAVNAHCNCTDQQYGAIRWSLDLYDGSTSTLANRATAGYGGRDTRLLESFDQRLAPQINSVSHQVARSASRARRGRKDKRNTVDHGRRPVAPDQAQDQNTTGRTASEQRSSASRVRSLAQQA
jgi:hypothetical protein